MSTLLLLTSIHDHRAEDDLLRSLLARPPIFFLEHQPSPLSSRRTVGPTCLSQLIPVPRAELHMER